jgi:general secretion pathway protein K
VRGSQRSEGFVLVVVVFFAALLFSAVATFLRRATLDAAIVRNRDSTARAEALARGGARLAVALVLQDRVDEAEAQLAVDGPGDPWALAAGVPIETEDGGRLSLRIEDAGSRLNLNAATTLSGGESGAAEAFVTTFLEKVIEEMPGRPEEKLYEPGELARNLVDFVDPDDVALRGGPEDDYYQQQDPPYRAANRPLLSVEELLLVRGFDPPLMEALRPYVTVHPLTGGGGINPNTAPPWVLASLYHGTAASGYRLVAEDDVRRILTLRERGARLCASGEAGVGGEEGCVPFSEAGLESVVPEASTTSDVFLVLAEARHGDVVRRLEAVLDRSDVSQPRFLAWRMR